MMVIFIVWISFIPFKQKTNLNLIKELRENKDFCDVVMPSKDTKILEFNQYKKVDKAASIIYADHESLIKKVLDGCKNNTEKSSTTKIGERIPCGYSMSMIWIIWWNRE